MTAPGLRPRFDSGTLRLGRCRDPWDYVEIGVVFASFAEATEIQYLFTTSDVPDVLRAWLERAGVTVVICDDAAPPAGDSR
jgi:hypothetical protein